MVWTLLAHCHFSIPKLVSFLAWPLSHTCHHFLSTGVEGATRDTALCLRQWLLSSLSPPERWGCQEAAQGSRHTTDSNGPRRGSGQTFGKGSPRLAFLRNPCSTECFLKVPLPINATQTTCPWVIRLQHTLSPCNNLYVVCVLVIVWPIRQIRSMHFFGNNQGLRRNYSCK